MGPTVPEKLAILPVRVVRLVQDPELITFIVIVDPNVGHSKHRPTEVEQPAAKLAIGSVSVVNWVPPLRSRGVATFLRDLLGCS